MIGSYLKFTILGDLLNLLRRQLISESILFFNNIFLFIGDEVSCSWFHWGKLGLRESELEAAGVFKSCKFIPKFIPEINHGVLEFGRDHGRLFEIFFNCRKNI